MSETKKQFTPEEKQRMLEYLEEKLKAMEIELQNYEKIRASKIETLTKETESFMS